MTELSGPTTLDSKKGWWSYHHWKFGKGKGKMAKMEKEKMAARKAAKVRKKFFGN